MRKKSVVHAPTGPQQGPGLYEPDHLSGIEDSQQYIGDEPYSRAYDKDIPDGSRENLKKKKKKKVGPVTIEPRPERSGRKIMDWSLLNKIKSSLSRSAYDGEYEEGPDSEPEPRVPSYVDDTPSRTETDNPEFTGSVTDRRERETEEQRQQREQKDLQYSQENLPQEVVEDPALEAAVESLVEAMETLVDASRNWGIAHLFNRQLRTARNEILGDLEDRSYKLVLGLERIQEAGKEELGKLLDEQGRRLDELEQERQRLEQTTEFGGEGSQVQKSLKRLERALAVKNIKTFEDTPGGQRVKKETHTDVTITKAQSGRVYISEVEKHKDKLTGQAKVFYDAIKKVEQMNSALNNAAREKTNLVKIVAAKLTDEYRQKAAEARIIFNLIGKRLEEIEQKFGLQDSKRNLYDVIKQGEDLVKPIELTAEDMAKGTAALADLDAALSERKSSLSLFKVTAEPSIPSDPDKLLDFAINYVEELASWEPESVDEFGAAFNGMMDLVPDFDPVVEYATSTLREANELNALVVGDIDNYSGWVESLPDPEVVETPAPAEPEPEPEPEPDQTPGFVDTLREMYENMAPTQEEFAYSAAALVRSRMNRQAADPLEDFPELGKEPIRKPEYGKGYKPKPKEEGKPKAPESTPEMQVSTPAMTPEEKKYREDLQEKRDKEKAEGPSEEDKKFKADLGKAEEIQEKAKVVTDDISERATESKAIQRSNEAAKFKKEVLDHRGQQRSHVNEMLKIAENIEAEQTYLDSLHEKSVELARAHQKTDEALSKVDSEAVRLGKAAALVPDVIAVFRSLSNATISTLSPKEVARLNNPKLSSIMDDIKNVFATKFPSANFDEHRDAFLEAMGLYLGVQKRRVTTKRPSGAQYPEHKKKVEKHFKKEDEAIEEKLEKYPKLKLPTDGIPDEFAELVVLREKLAQGEPLGQEQIDTIRDLEEKLQSEEITVQRAVTDKLQEIQDIAEQSAAESLNRIREEDQSETEKAKPSSITRLDLTPEQAEKEEHLRQQFEDGQITIEDYNAKLNELRSQSYLENLFKVMGAEEEDLLDHMDSLIEAAEQVSKAGDQFASTMSSESEALESIQGILTLMEEEPEASADAPDDAGVADTGGWADMLAEAPQHITDWLGRYMDLLAPDSPALAAATQRMRNMEKKAISDFGMYDISQNRLEIIESEDGSKKLVVNKDLKNIVTKRVQDMAKGAHKVGQVVQIDYGHYLGSAEVKSYLGKGVYQVKQLDTGRTIEVDAKHVLTDTNGIWR